MKKLYLVRHAKSTREYPELTDFERPLNIRGRIDAPVMSELLKKLGVAPDIIMSSPANRALATARLFAEHLHYPLNKIRVIEEIYEAWRENLVDVLKIIDSDKSSVILIGHNPGLQLLAEFLCDFPHENIPTCGVVGLELQIEDWAEIKEKCGKLMFFEFPKKLKL